MEPKKEIKSQVGRGAETAMKILVFFAAAMLIGNAVYFSFVIFWPQLV